jgi:hypothetical protein
LFSPLCLFIAVIAFLLSFYKVPGSLDERQDFLLKINPLQSHGIVKNSVK